MSTEISTREESSTIELLPPAQPVSSSSVAMLKQHANAMHIAFDLADKLVRTEMVPARFRGAQKADDATATILYGSELGLNPIQALQNIFPVHGQPSMYARTMEALLRRQGFRFKTIEATDLACERWCWAPGTPRDAEPDEKARFTMEMAYQREYVPTKDDNGEWRKNSNGKLQGNMKYLTHPDEMVWAKTTALLCRHAAPEILLGMPFSAEEMESEYFEERPQTQAVSKGTEPITVEEILSPGQGGDNDQNHDAEPSSGVTGQGDSSDQDGEDAAETVDETDAPAEESAPEPETPQPSEPQPSGDDPLQLNRRMHVLFAKADLQKGNRADRLIVTSKIVGREISSSNDLTRDEAQKVVDYLGQWYRDGVIGERVTDILNQHAIDEADAADAAAKETEK